jgi:hypothetical protein
VGSEKFEHNGFSDRDVCGRGRQPPRVETITESRRHMSLVHKGSAMINGGHNRFLLPMVHSSLIIRPRRALVMIGISY